MNYRNIINFILIVFFCFVWSCDAEENMLVNQAVIAAYPTPVYSVKDIPALYYNSDGMPELKLDKFGHLRELEFIALPSTKFELMKTEQVKGRVIYQVKTGEYPAADSLYVDARFVRVVVDDYPQRRQKMPVKSEIIKSMLGMVGQPYRWGGNFYQGIKQMEIFYPFVKGKLADSDQKAWCLEGVDCSGLLYQATGGAIPRNTAQLVGFGKAVKISGCSVREIISRVKPLDMIVWNGHVIYVLDSENVIESRPRYDDGAVGGVRVHSLRTVLEGIMESRVPVDDYYSSAVKHKRRFVIRRFL